MASQESEAYLSAERERHPRVTAVLLHYGLAEDGGNASGFTEQCLHSLEKTSYSNFDVVIVDAGSTDAFSKKHEERFSKEFPGLAKATLLRRADNVGCAEGFNIGAEYAIREGAEYVFLLNNDTVILDGDTVSKLVEVLEQFPEVAAVGPKIYYWKEGEKDKDVFQFVGGRFSFKVVGVGQVDKGQFERERFVDFLSGAAMLVRSEVIKELGLFDPRFFIYMEELDFASRAKEAGYKFMYSPKGKVMHKGRYSIDRRFDEPYVTASARNLVFLVKKHTGKRRVEFILRAATVIGKSVAGVVLVEKNPGKLKRIFQAISEGTKLK